MEKAKKPCIVIYGNQNSGKSSIWNKVFNYTKKRNNLASSIRTLKINNKAIKVLLISTSCEETKLEIKTRIKKYIKNTEIDLILISVQRNDKGILTLQELKKLGYSISIFELRPETTELDLNIIESFYSEIEEKKIENKIEKCANAILEFIESQIQ